MTTIRVCRSSLLVAAAMLLASCASMETGDPQVLQMEPPGAITDNQTHSVIRFADDPAPSGQAEFVTITDSAGNTLFEAEVPPNKQITVTAPADGMLFISTRWTEGRTRQEIDVLESGKVSPKPGGDVTLGLNEATREYAVRMPSLPEIPVPGRALLSQNATGAAKPYPREVTVTDGAGRILYSGPASDEIDVVATGGTLVITTDWSHGESTRQEITYTDSEVSFDEWDEYVTVAWDGYTRQHRLKSPWSVMMGPISLRSMRFDVGVGEFSDKPPTVGVVTGVDEPLLEGSDEVSYQGLNLGLTFGRWGRFVPSLELGAIWGDDERRGERAGVNSGWAFQGGLSPGGSPGIASVGGARASLETDYTRQSLYLNLSDKFKLDTSSQASIDYTLGLQRSVRDYRGEVALLAFPDITSIDKQEITGYDLGVGIGLRGRHTFPNKWSLSAAIGLDAVYYRGRYDGKHVYACSVCAPSDQEFSQSTRDKDDGFTWATRMTGWVGYQVKNQSELFLGLDYRYQDEAPVLRNRTVPSDPAPYLDTDKLDWQSIRVGFNHRY